MNPETGGRHDRRRHADHASVPHAWEAPCRWRHGTGTGHWVPLVDRRDLRVVMNRFLLYPHGLIFSIDLATGSESQPRSASAAGVGFDDVMSVAVRFPEGLEAVTCLIVPGRRPGFAIGVSYLGSGESDPGATCLRVLAAEGTDDTASYTMWLWPQPPGVFEVELDWSAGGLQLATMVDLPWIPSVWGPTVLT